jgi:hypothetical protein
MENVHSSHKYNYLPQASAFIRLTLVLADMKGVARLCMTFSILGAFTI